MSDELESLRTDALSQNRWTAGIALSLITITLTILTLHDDISNIGCWLKTSAYATTGFSIITILFSILEARNYLKLRAIFAELNMRQRSTLPPDKKKPTNAEEKEIIKRKNRAKPLGSTVLVFIIISFLSFISYLVSYIR